MVHPEQITAAENIRLVFVENKTRYALLMAKCQAGKTGAFQELIKRMLQDGDIQRAYILCGSSETELRDQAKKDTVKANGDYYELNEKGEQSGDIEVLFRQDFKAANMDITNALLVVDESHLDQNQKQQLDQFLGRHGLSMDGNPKTLDEKNAFILSVDATPYSELAALTHKETPFKKHIEELQVGEGYFGLTDYTYNGLVKPTFDIASTPHVFANLLASIPGKYGIIRLTNGKHAEAQKSAILSVCVEKGYKVRYYTASKTNIAVTRDEQKDFKKQGKEVECLEDAPSITTVAFVCGRLRAGKVVPKQHIGFVWEGAKNSKTDALVQGLPGRMCGYKFGATKPLIFMPPSALAEHEKKVIKASEISRAMMGHPCALPTKGTNLKKPHVATRPSNGTTQCPPLRLEWPSADKEVRGTDGEDCRRLLLANRKIIQSAPFSEEQKAEILSFIRTAQPHTRTLANGNSDSFKKYFSAVIEAHKTKTAVAENVSDFSSMTFFITKDAIVPHSNVRYVYVVFYTKADGIVPSIHLESRIPMTNGKSVFSIHDSHLDRPVAAGGVVGFDESKLKTPVEFESALRSYIMLWKGSSLTVSRCIESVKERFAMSKAAFHYASAKENDVEKILKKLSTEFGIKLVVKYTRSAAEYFNVKTITWENS